jgi:hypothetical protein
MGMTRSDFRLVADDLGVGWLHVPSGRRLPFVSGGDGDTKTKAKADGNGETAAEEETEFEIPEDVSTIPDSDLDEKNPDSLISRAKDVLAAMAEEAAAPDRPAPDAEQVQAARDLAAAIAGLKEEGKTRAAAAAERRREFEEAVSSIKDQETEPGEGEEGEGEGGEEPAPGEQPAPEQPTDVPAEAEAATSNGQRKGPLVVKRPTLNPTLADIAKRQTDTGVVDRRPTMTITAAADVPHFGNGEEIASLEALAQAATERCKALGIGNGTPHFVPLANIQREFPMVIDPDTMTPQQVRTAWNDYVSELTGGKGIDRAGMEAVVAAGGWCAPSEIRYDFFKISEVAGLLDLPTFGVRRGGLKWPQSLSLADFFALAGAPTSGLPTNATMPWEWTETDDIAAVAGTPTKACLRPPCPSFDEARLRLFGLCVLAGNLTEDAFPELVRHFLGQTVVAHARVINRRMILQVVAASGTVIDISAATPAGDSAINAWLGGLELQATDYRELHGMRDTAVLEVVAPSWARGALRSDVSRKNGIDRLDAADSYLMSLFDSRNLRVQWVQDWQTRLASGIANLTATRPTSWPATADVVMYAPN